MTDKYKDKYRPETTRLKGWNYASAGYYFVTICEKNRNRVFGEICNYTVAFTPLGKVAIECWMGIPQHFPFVELDAFCIMPNHIHGIIVINTHDSVPAVETQNVETQDFASLLQWWGESIRHRPEQFPVGVVGRHPAIIER